MEGHHRYLESPFVDLTLVFFMTSPTLINTLSCSCLNEIALLVNDEAHLLLSAFFRRARYQTNMQKTFQLAIALCGTMEETLDLMIT